MTTHDIGRLQGRLDTHATAATLLAERVVARYRESSFDLDTRIALAKLQFQADWVALTADVNVLAGALIEGWLRYSDETGNK